MTHPDRRRRGRRIRKTRRAFMRVGMRFEATGKAADQAARAMVKVGRAFADPRYPTMHELNAMNPLKGVHWLGFGSVEP